MMTNSVEAFEQAFYAMPDAHCGYEFPIRGVVASDPEQGGGIRRTISRCGAIPV